MIDVNDLNKLDCERARVALENLDDLVRMGDMVPIGPYNVLNQFIDQVEALQRKYTKPIAALLKKD